MIFPPLIALGAAAGGAALARGLFAGYPVKRLADSPLSAKEQAIIAACADTFFPPNGPIPVAGTAANLVEYMDRYVARLPDTQRVLVRLLLVFIEHGPWVFGPSRVRFSSLDEASRLAVLDGMRASPIYFRRIAFLSMRTMLTMGYMAHPDVARAMRCHANLDPFSTAASPS